MKTKMSLLLSILLLIPAFCTSAAPKINKVHHIAVICSDYKSSLDFYTNVLGMKILTEEYHKDQNSYKTELGLGDQYVIELFSFAEDPSRKPDPKAAGVWHLAFEVDNVADAVAELDKMGIAHDDIKIDTTHDKKIVFFKDPDGLPIEFYEK